MITSIAQKLLSSFNGDQTYGNNSLMDYNQTVSSILDLICSNTKLHGPKSNSFSREELRPIAQNFLSHKNTNLFHRLRTNSTEDLTTDFLIDNTGKFHIVIPHLSFFCSKLHGFDEDALKSFERKVLKPYAKQIARGKPLSETLRQKLQDNIKRMLPPTNDNSNSNALFSQYIVDSILDDPKFIKSTLQSVDSKPSIGSFFQRFTRPNAILQSLRHEFTGNKFNNASIPESFDSIRQLYYTSKATLEALSIDLPSLSPEELEHHLISLNDTLLKLTGPSSVYYKPGQYREQPVEVGIKSLVLNGDRGFVDGFDPQCTERISKAMKPLSSDIISLAQNASTMSLDEYTRQVALIHFRYINIHPFSDGNGRTGRLITNMLLKEKGMLFNIDSPEAKDKYLQVMNSVEHNVLQHMNPSDYLANLYTSPNLNRAAEEASISELSNFIRVHTFNPSIAHNAPSHEFHEWYYSPGIESDPDLSQDL